MKYRHRLTLGNKVGWIIVKFGAMICSGDKSPHRRQNNRSQKHIKSTFAAENGDTSAIYWIEQNLPHRKQSTGASVFLHDDGHNTSDPLDWNRSNRPITLCTHSKRNMPDAKSHSHPGAMHKWQCRRMIGVLRTANGKRWVNIAISGWVKTFINQKQHGFCTSKFTTFNQTWILWERVVRLLLFSVCWPPESLTTF